MIQPSCWRKLLPFKLLSRVVFLDGICTFAVNSLIWSTLNYQVEDGTWVVFSEIIQEWFFWNKCTWNYVKKAGGLIHSMHHFGWYLHHKNTMFSRDGTWKIKLFGIDHFQIILEYCQWAPTLLQNQISRYWTIRWWLVYLLQSL